MFGYVCASFSAAPEYEEIDEDEAEGVEEDENLQDVPLEEEVQEETEDREPADGGVAGVTEGGEEGGEGVEGEGYYDLSSYDEPTEVSLMFSCPPTKLVD